MIYFELKNKFYYNLIRFTFLIFINGYLLNYLDSFDINTLSIGRFFMKLFEEFKLFEIMWDGDPAVDSTDEKELDACLSRVNKSSMEAVSYEDMIIHIPVKLSKEDLKKALRLGNWGICVDPQDSTTVPAQLVDEVYLCVIGDYESNDYFAISLHLGGENPVTGETTIDYCNDDIVVVGSKNDPTKTFGSVVEFTEYCNKTIIPNATKIAHEIIEHSWAESGYTDFAGITDYKSSYADAASYKVVFKDDTNNAIYSGTKPSCERFASMVAKMPYVKVHGGVEILVESKGLTEWKAASNQPQQSLTWEELLERADELLTELSVVSDNKNYDDSDGYWEEEYTDWCNRYLYYSDTLNNSNKLEKLCDDYSKKLPNIEFYYVEDEDICEIGYLATR